MTHEGGISAIKISNTSGGIEADHIQYGLRGATDDSSDDGPTGVPTPTALLLLGSGLMAAGVSRFARRKR